MLIVIVADNTVIFFFIFSETIRFDSSCKSSAKQMICMNCQTLFFSDKYFFFKIYSECGVLKFCLAFIAIYGLIQTIFLILPEC